MSTGHILGEGAAIFTDMTETMLTTLDQQMALSDKAQKPEGSLLSNLLVPGQVSNHGSIEESKTKPYLSLRYRVSTLIYIYQSQKIIK